MRTLIIAIVFVAGCIGGDDDSSSTAPFEFTACAADVDDMTNGTLDSVWHYSYDTSGCPTLDELDTANDGTTNTRVTYQYELSAGHCRMLTMAFDNTADGKTDSKYTYVYSGALQTSEEFDSDGNGTIDQRGTYVYENGVLVRVDTDRGLDGTIDSVTRYTYDAAGELSMLENDNNGDGRVDFRTTYHRDSAGHVTRMETDYTGPTGGPDGTPDFIYESFYDGDRLTRSTSDDGTAPIDSTMTYRYSCP